jgi:hypothetical protein
MSWTAKSRYGPPGTLTPAAKPGLKASSVEVGGNIRVSNGLKEFLWLTTEESKQGRLLDLGAVFQSTVMFFIERGFRLSTEDMMRSWKEFLITEEGTMRKMQVGAEGERVSQGTLAGKFLESNLQYPEDSFHGVLAWDLFDYMDAELLPRVMERLYTILRPGGAVLASFHSKTPERFNRYKIVDGQNIELIPSPTLAVHARIFQNREILDIFGKFRSSKTFVGRDQVREAIFLK